MTIAIEPMICQYDCKITQTKDGWTVKTKDGGLAAHFEHSMAITAAGAEVMTQGWEEPGWTYRGQLVRSKAGRDKTRICAVLAVDGPMLWLADGNLRKVGDPKRKKAEHVAPTSTVLANELLKSDQ